MITIFNQDQWSMTEKLSLSVYVGMFYLLGNGVVLKSHETSESHYRCFIFQMSYYEDIVVEMSFALLQCLNSDLPEQTGRQYFCSLTITFSIHSVMVPQITFIFFDDPA